VHEPLLDPHKERKEAYKNNEEVQEKKKNICHTHIHSLVLSCFINQPVSLSQQA